MLDTLTGSERHAPPDPDPLRRVSLREQFSDHPLALRVLSICGLVALVDGIDTQMLASLAPRIVGSLDIQLAGFAPVFAAGLFGMMVGSLVCGSAADVLGRKRMIVASVIVFAIGTLATAFVETRVQLMAVRFVAGIGIGGALPNVLALAAEYSPPRSRALLMNMMFVGYPAGGVLAGVSGSMLVEYVDWRSLFIAAGAVSLVLAAPVIAFLPESREVGRGVPGRRNGGLGARIGALFAGGRAEATAFLWIANFLSLMVIVFMVTWLTALLTREAMPLSRAVLFPSLFSLGGILGAVSAGSAMDRARPLRILVYGMLAGAAALLSLRWTVGGGLIGAAVFAAGFFVIGAQTGLQAVAATLYPGAVRATGIGWAMAMGRIGSVTGPLTGGVLLAASWSSPAILASMAVPTFLAAIAIAALMTARERHASRPEGVTGND